MIESKDFVSYLKELEISPFLMVPCSIFKPLASWMISNNEEILFPPNEAHAMGFAVGSYCATGKSAVIFLQNSGLNNIANCQTSLNLLYKVPVFLVISWRGEKVDAPEHEIMGKNLSKFLKTLQIPFIVLSKNWKEDIKKMAYLLKKEKKPVAVVVREGTFEKEQFQCSDLTDEYHLSRFKAIEIIKNNLKEKTVFISTNGFITRDSFAVSDSPDFYMVGSMGHAFSIGAGTAWSLSKINSKLKVVVFDGDGGCLMHLGSLSLIALDKIRKSNLVYVLLDNEAYESTGSQPTLSRNINFLKIAKGLGFPQYFFIKTPGKLKKVIKNLKRKQATFLHVKINRKKISEATRVSDKYTCEQIISRFMKNFF